MKKMQMTSIVLDLGTFFMLNQNSNDTIWFNKTCIYKAFNCKIGQVNTHSDIKMIFLCKLIHILNYILTLYKLTKKSTTSMTCEKQVIVFMGKYVCFLPF